MAERVYIIIFGICQIISGLVMLGIWSKFVYDNNSSLDLLPSIRASLVGHLLIGLIVILSGLLALPARSKTKEVWHVISAAVAATLSTAMLWNNATKLSDYNNSNKCDALHYDLTAASLAFSTISLIASFIGMIMTALSLCRQ